jgi:hypothetical protein
MKGNNDDDDVLLSKFQQEALRNALSIHIMQTSQQGKISKESRHTNNKRYRYNKIAQR